MSLPNVPRKRVLAFVFESYGGRGGGGLFLLFRLFEARFVIFPDPALFLMHTFSPLFDQLFIMTLDRKMESSRDKHAARTSHRAIENR